MKQNYKLYLCALLLIGAVNTMTIGALGADKPKLAVFVVGNEAIGASLTTALGANLTSGGRYALTSVDISSKLTELKAAYTAGGGSSIDRNALAAWGHANGIDAICLVVDDVKGNDNLFSAQLIDTKDSQLEGKGSYVRTGVGSGEVAWVSLALAKQLEGPGRKRSVNVTPQQKWFEPELVFVEGGTFTMGCTPEQGTYCEAHEKPTHSVTVSSFSIGKYEVTQAQWKAVMAGHPLENAYSWKIGNCGNVPCDDQRPVENVSWLDIDTAFLPRLNRITGKNYRLPREAEWEYAARGCKRDGSSTTCENFLYSGSSNANEVAWHTGNASGTTHPIGQKKPNRLGIYDMSGNVWEFVNDWFSTYTSEAVTNPEGPKNGSYRVLRGGGLDGQFTQWHRISVRFSSWKPENRQNNIGFRVVLPAQ
jgi:formylglycine-generating enzyme required for sulfatase activity